MDKLNSFWENSDENTVDVIINEGLIEEAEKKIGRKLPGAYLEILNQKNGGVPKKKYFQIDDSNDNYIEIASILGIGGERGIDGELGSRYLIDEWGYPDSGVIFGHGIAGGTVIMFDYLNIELNDEPEVIFIDLEFEEKILLAKNFETFVKGLKTHDSIINLETELDAVLRKVRVSPFSRNLEILISNQKIIPFLGEKIRAIAEEITIKKGDFLFHSDELSYLMYDIQFFLYYNYQSVSLIEEFYKIFPSLIALADGFSTDGYAKQFLEKWFSTRKKNNQIIESEIGLTFNRSFEAEILFKLSNY